MDFSFLREKYYSLKNYLLVNYITTKKRVKKKRENQFHS
ncbi:hypothetical protein SMIM3IV_01828 [Streptococcus mitis]|nr:hypothetical protein SMIM3IV_01828 [Streptococcus mitis]